MIRAYCRVSTLEQASADKTSLADQERRVRGAAMMRGDGDIVVYCDPGVSGSVPLAQRPCGARMLSDLQKGDVVIAAKLDRLFRSASDALNVVEDLQKRGIGVVLADIGPEPVTENGMAKLFFSMLASFAEFERWRIAERMADGRRGKKARNGHAGGSAPFGFRVIGNGRDATLESIPQEQKIIEFASSLDGKRSLRQIAAEMEDRGMVSRSGKPFVANQVKRLIRHAVKQAAE